MAPVKYGSAEENEIDQEAFWSNNAKEKLLKEMAGPRVITTTMSMDQFDEIIMGNINSIQKNIIKKPIIDEKFYYHNNN